MERRTRIRRKVIFYYQLTIQYKGTAYLGWQIQPESMGHTVQGELNKALESISGQKSLSMGAGRTDAGVHALGQVAKVGIELSIAPEKLQRALNAKLPIDIRVVEAKGSDHDFLPTVHAISKEYHYRFTCQKTFTAIQNDLIYNHPFELDLNLMMQACKVLIGTHDFVNYFCEGTKVSSTTRSIYECEIIKIENKGWEILPTHYIFRIVGSGFLKQMVRLLMGALWNVGRGKLSLEQFQKSLSIKQEKRLGAVAPAQGLYMVRVNY